MTDPEFTATTLEVSLHMDLGGHAPANLTDYARALATTLESVAQEHAAESAEASGSEEARAARPTVAYRVLDADGWTNWQTIRD